ncbi:phage tail tape measure protein [Yinghuangia sp. YIM S09857]|uniref:phage tail tape measure protein n=1 Tax=Yinghuangia sp. YIM S09857 TaxID=3436929 RepID=UPI003F53CF71
MGTIDDILVAIGVKTDDLTEGTQDAANQAESSLKGIAAAAAGGAVGALFVSGLGAAMDISSATSQLEYQLGLTAEEAERVGGVASDTFAAGWGESAAEVSESLGAVIANFGQLGDTSDAELEQMTKSAMALSKVFKFDVAESTQAIGGLLKVGLVSSAEEGFDLMTAAAQKLPPAMAEELPVLMKEYTEFFAQMGFSAEDAFGIMVQAAQQPTFELDKLGDAVKEFTLRIADTDAVKEPLEDLGLKVSDIQKMVNTGQGTKAFDTITQALLGVEDATERTMIQAALFGGPGEDLGISLLTIGAEGAGAATGMDKAAGAAAKITESMEKSPAQQYDAAMRTITTTIGESLLPVVNKLSAFMSEHPGLIKAAIPIVGGLAAVLGITAAAVWAVNLAMSASPITWIILGIVALVAAIALIIIKWDEVAAATTRVWNWIKDTVLAPTWNWIKNAAQETWSAITGWVTTAWDATGDAIGAGVDWIKKRVDELAAIPGKVGGWFSGIARDVASWPGKIAEGAKGMWNAIPDGFRSAVNGVISGWNNLSFTVGGGSFMGVKVPSFTLHTPDLPYLAQGGIIPATPGGMLAVVGEGSQSEAVIPLDRLDSMMRSVAGAVRGPAGGAAPQRIVLDVTGSDADLVRMVRRWVRVQGRGDVQTALGR